MTELDFDSFGAAFERIAVTFRAKLTAKEAKALPGIYFRALQPYPLEDVLLAGKTCVDRGKRFPQVKDWIDALASGPTPANCPGDVRQMRAAELDEHYRAESLGYADTPCNCLECQAARVTLRELQFVPNELGDGFASARGIRDGAKSRSSGTGRTGSSSSAGMPPGRPSSR